MKTEDYSFEQMAEAFDLFQKLGEILNPSFEQMAEEFDPFAKLGEILNPNEDEKPFNDQINF